VGQREITIYVVVFGQENRIEEDIAKLVELELGIRINADKGDIHRAYASCRVEFERIVEPLIEALKRKDLCPKDRERIISLLKIIGDPLIEIVESILSPEEL